MNAWAPCGSEKSMVARKMKHFNTSLANLQPNK